MKTSIFTRSILTLVLPLFSFLIGVSNVSAETSPFTAAQWIWPNGTPSGDFQVSLFRTTMTLSSVPSSVNLMVGADSKYHLWVNGTYVNTGPARSHKAHPYYDTHNIKSLVHTGRNTIAFRVQSYLAHKNIFQEVRGGLICQINSPTAVLSASSSNWRTMVSPAYQSMPGNLYAEVCDARQEAEGWQNDGFNDSGWPFAVVLTNTGLAPRENFTARPIPNLTQTTLASAKVVQSGTCVDPSYPANPNQDWHVGNSWMRSTLTPFSGSAYPTGTRPGDIVSGSIVFPSPAAGTAIYVELDLGRNSLVHPELQLSGPWGGVVDILYGETLNSDRVAAVNGSTESFDRVILRGGTTQYRTNQPRGCRYMVLRLSGYIGSNLTLTSLVNRETIYPATSTGSFTCSDSTLNQVYQMASRTVNLCMEDSYTDCIWRERAQYLGDVQVESLFSYYTSGGWNMARKALREFAASNDSAGWVPGLFPSAGAGNFPSWDLRFPVAAWDYYLFTGDSDTLALCLTSCQQMMNWFATQEHSSGLLNKWDGWNFVDWTASDWDQGDGAIQGWYVDALDHCALMARALGNTTLATQWETKAATLRQTIATNYWSASRGAFLVYSPLLGRRPSTTPADAIGQHENFLFSYLGIGTAAQRASGLNAIRGANGFYLPELNSWWSRVPGVTPEPNDPRLVKIGTPFWSFYALQSLIQAGLPDAAIQYIRLCWPVMQVNGDTSCWEIWDTQWSHCHGWSAAPAMILPYCVLGVRPTTPGFVQFDIQPTLAGLQSASGVIPSPKGNINMAWSLLNSGATMQVNVTVPTGTTANLTLPAAYRPAVSPRVLSAGTYSLQFPKVTQTPASTTGIRGNWTSY